jgi:hypothetical protein
MSAYLLINKETKLAENAVEWNGNTSVWSPPDTHITIPVAGTPSIDWIWNEGTQQWEAEETIGNGGVGDTWDGAKLVEPKPENPPESE